MPLYSLMREYEERRQALIEQLKKSPNMDPAVQHQIYGAIKEIENFLKTVEFHIAAGQERGIGIDLAREKHRPLVEKTKRLAGRVKKGTKSVASKMKEHARKFNEKRKIAKEQIKLRKLMRKQLEQELQVRMKKHASELEGVPEHAHSNAERDAHLPTFSSGKLEPETSGKSPLQMDEPRQEAEPVRQPSKKPRKAPKKAKKKARKKKR